jgi:hypothetical protein
MRYRTFLFASWLVGGCAPDELPGDLGECPEDSDIGWSDVAPIFEAHCTRCHATTLTGSARSGAPEFVDFNTSNAAATNGFLTWSMIWTEQMPKAADPLTEDDARLVWEWLSCEGPS